MYSTATYHLVNWTCWPLCKHCHWVQHHLSWSITVVDESCLPLDLYTGICVGTVEIYLLIVPTCKVRGGACIQYLPQWSSPGQVAGRRLFALLIKSWWRPKYSLYCGDVIYLCSFFFVQKWGCPCY